MDMYEVVKYLHDGCDDETFAEIFVRYYYMCKGYPEDRDLNDSDMFIDIEHLIKHLKTALSEIIYSDEICQSAWWKQKAYVSFIDDTEKMQDFCKLTKAEFLESYSYLTEEEYELTRAELERRTA